MAGVAGEQTWNVESIGCPWCPLAITYTTKSAIRGRWALPGAWWDKRANKQQRAAGQRPEKRRGRVQSLSAGGGGSTVCGGLVGCFYGGTTRVYRRQVGRMASWRGVNVLCSET